MWRFSPPYEKLPPSGLEWLCVCFWYGMFTVVAPKVNQQYKVVTDPEKWKLFCGADSVSVVHTIKVLTAR